MPDAWATNTMKAAIRVWLTARDRAITAGHELVEMVEDLVEEVRHEREMEARTRAAQPPVPAPTPTVTVRRRTKAAANVDDDLVATPRASRARRSTAKAGKVEGVVTDQGDGESAARPVKAPRRTGGGPKRKRPAAASAGGDTATVPPIIADAERPAAPAEQPTTAPPVAPADPPAPPDAAPQTTSTPAAAERENQSA